MVIGSYSRTFENERGIVTVQVSNSDMQGATLTVLVRYGDNRPDKTYGKGGLTDFKETCNLADRYYQSEIKEL